MPNVNFDPVIFDQTLLKLIHQRPDGSSRIVSPVLHQAIEYSLLATGKRIRPRLVFATAALFGLSYEATTRLAAAIEMLHCFSLIHDDLPCLDDDDERRGRPSNHKVYGEGMGLLAGDLLTALPFEILAEISDAEPRALVAAIGVVSRSIAGVIGGQALEISTLDSPSLNNTEKVHYFKTALLFECCISATGTLANADQQSLTLLQSFGKTLGLAFQAQDDLADSENEDPSSLLHYLNRNEIQKRSLSDLGKAVETLQLKFEPTKTEALVRIAQSVLDALKNA